MLANYTIDGFENIKYQGFGQLKYIEERLANLFEKYGYCQVEIPTFENYEFYSSDEAINRNDLFKFISNSGKVLALKPDATLPITRIAAINHHDPEEVVKFSYQTNIYKDFSSPDSSKKETTQSGIEYFGNSDPSCDGEIITLALASLELFGIKNIHIDLGHVGFINALLDELYLNKNERDHLFNLIENKNIGDIKEFLETKENISEEYKKIILKLPRLYGKPEDVFKEMETLAVTPKMRTVLERLQSVYNYLCSVGAKDYIHLDIGFTNRMSYYTGIIFKAYLDGVGESILSGGRYDSLSAKFGIDRPACGFSLDLLLLLEYLNNHNLFPDNSDPKIIILYPEEEREKAFSLCSDYRNNGRSAEMFVLNHSPEIVTNRLLKNPHYKNSEFYLLKDNNLTLWQKT